MKASVQTSNRTESQCSNSDFLFRVIFLKLNYCKLIMCRVLRKPFFSLLASYLSQNNCRKYHISAEHMIYYSICYNINYILKRNRRQFSTENQIYPKYKFYFAIFVINLLSQYRIVS